MHNLHLELSHDYYGRGSSFDIWHIVGIILGIILLLAIIGFIINCIRNRGFGFGGQPYGQTYQTGGQVFY
jgi:hypothetical protein